MIFAKALPVKLRALWFVASIISSVWFLYWICYDVLVWNKALTQAAPANYVGFTVSIVLAILGTQLGKPGISEKPMLPPEQNPEQNVHKEVNQKQQALEEERNQPIDEEERVQPIEQKLGISEKPMLPPEQNIHKKVNQKQQALEEERVQPIEQVQQIQPAEEETTQIPPDASIPPGCKFYLGYLHMRPESVEIPEECLECEHVVECLSPTASTIETASS